MPPFAPGLNAAETHTFVIAFMNPLSTGSITLRSANPSDPPVVDPKMFSHPFDRRAAIETMREAFRFLDTLKLEYIIAPKDRSDETIWVSLHNLAEIKSLRGLRVVVKTGLPSHQIRKNRLLQYGQVLTRYSHRNMWQPTQLVCGIQAAP